MDSKQTTKGNQMQSLTAIEVSAKFPKLIGPIQFGEVYGDQTLVNMGRGSWAVLNYSSVAGVCPSRVKAIALITKCRDSNRSYLDGSRKF